MTDRYPVAYVEWVDAGIAATRWEDRADVLATAVQITDGLVISAGLLIHKDKDRIVLALSFNPNNDDVNLALTIPRKVIRRLDLWDRDAGRDDG